MACASIFVASTSKAAISRSGLSNLSYSVGYLLNYQPPSCYCFRAVVLVIKPETRVYTNSPMEVSVKPRKGTRSPDLGRVRVWAVFTTTQSSLGSLRLSETGAYGKLLIDRQGRHTYHSTFFSSKEQITPLASASTS